MDGNLPDCHQAAALDGLLSEHRETCPVAAGRDEPQEQGSLFDLPEARQDSQRY